MEFPILKRALIVSTISITLVGCAGAPLGLDMGQKPMAGTWKGDFVCPPSRMSMQSFTLTLQDGGIPGAVNGIVENHLVWAGQPQYLKYTVVGSNVAGHVVLKPKQLNKRSRDDFEMGYLEGDLADADTIHFKVCGREHTLTRLSAPKQTVQR
ncbi:hypothetical protein [Pseudomonas sp. PDM19]|uniref:hypothetical protein n=1 Tax=Pseudomonas sp. PDM19 TaxID=2769272 RepID=UPI001786D702|nr:hypothetical protein [Pseudomonas sp. PDM19]MBD9630010.1 hypothetical protein [Pseudomonas sp. PDM19]